MEKNFTLARGSRVIEFQSGSVIVGKAQHNDRNLKLAGHILSYTQKAQWGGRGRGSRSRL